MSPRAYKAGERRLAATEATRTKIVAAARDLLADRSVTALSVDAIAERADVARMTVYYQFKSKAKLLEALLDDLAARADMRNMRKVFEERDPGKSLDLLVDVFCNLWKTQGPLVRRLEAFATLDETVEVALRERGGWRREAIARLLERMTPRRDAADVVDVVHALTSFETYAALCTGRRDHKRVAAVLKETVRAIVRGYR